MVEILMIINLMSREVPHEGVIKINHAIWQPPRVIELQHERKIRDMYHDFNAYQAIAQSA